MDSKTWTRIIALTLFAATAIPVQLAAQQHIHYTITDLGTLGGTWGEGFGINNKGWVAGKAAMPGDQNGHAFLWRNGKITDLGTLGGPNSEPSFSPFSEKGDVGGAAETPNPDPNGEDFCYFGTYLTCLPVLWHDGGVTVLPTLGGNNGVANQVNNRGQVAGVAENGVTLPPCLQGLALPVLWNKGQIQALPMFSGDQAGVALAINDRGEAAGFSASCTGLHALIWLKGKAINLGNLGGSANLASAINNAREVVGQSSLPGDGTADAFLWRDGAMIDLGTLAGDVGSNALGINDRTQVVGTSSDTYGNPRAFLWERGTMIDLNNLIPAASPWFVFEADSINSRGEIAGGAFNMTTGENRAMLAIPCDENHSGIEGCDYSKDIETATARSETSETPKLVLPENVREMLRQRPGSRYHIPSMLLPSSGSQTLASPRTRNGDAQ